MIKHNGNTISITCDNCSDVVEAILPFREAIEAAKNDGWVIAKNGDGWLHFCSNECSISYP
jgi:hypothetical protein